MEKKNNKILKTKDAKLEDVKLAKKTYFYGELNCISCTYILPLVNYGVKHNWFLDSEINILKSKQEYIDTIQPILDKYNLEKITAPIILMTTFEDRKGLVRPSIIAEASSEIMEHFKVLESDAYFDYLDNDLELDMFFANLVFKMATSLIYADEIE